MSASYEIWDQESGNLVSYHATEADALAFVRAEVAMHRQFVAQWGLVRDDENGDAALIAEGAALVAVAQAMESRGHDADDGARTTILDTPHRAPR